MSETQPSNGILLIKITPQIPILFFPFTRRENSLLWLLRQKCIFQKDLFILGVLDTLAFLAFQRKVNPIVYLLFHFFSLYLLLFTSFSKPQDQPHVKGSSLQTQSINPTLEHLLSLISVKAAPSSGHSTFSGPQFITAAMLKISFLTSFPN